MISQDFGAQQAGTYAAPIGNGTVAVPLYRKWNVVTVDVGPYRYQWQEKGNNYVILTVNDDVSFYRDGDWFVAVDTKNKKHKFSVISATKQ